MNFRCLPTLRQVSYIEVSHEKRAAKLLPLQEGPPRPSARPRGRNSLTVVTEWSQTDNSVPKKDPAFSSKCALGDTLRGGRGDNGSLGPCFWEPYRGDKTVKNPLLDPPGYPL